MLYILSLVLSYVMGGIPSAVILSKLFGKTDPRYAGSKNVGTTNMWRLNGKWFALGTFLLDFFKGFGAMLLAFYLSPESLLLSALCVVLGHIFPFQMKFKGGKGVATAAGVLMFLSWPLTLLLGSMWLIITKTTRFASIASLSVLVSAPVLFYFFRKPYTPTVFLLALILLLAHVPNIFRLLQKKEHSI